MPCYTDECNQAPFELFDPTLIYPERSPRGATPQSSPSRPILGQIGYPLCFHSDPFCLSYNPFLLITIWIAYVAICFCPVLASLFRSLCKEQNASPFFSIVSALFTKNAGVYPASHFSLAANGQRPAPNAPFATSATISKSV